MFLFDTHVHTSEISPCGNITAKETVKLYKKAGYDGICITDHYRKDIFDSWDGSWEQKLSCYLEGYHNALSYGAEIGLTVLLGAELAFSGLSNEYLLYGLTEEFLYSYSELYNYDIKTLHTLLKEYEVFLYHNYIDRKSTRLNSSH